MPLEFTKTENGLPVQRMHVTRINFLEKKYCKRQASFLWGRKRIVKPELLTISFGDGNKIIALRSINTRRDHYVVALDSRTGICGEDAEIDIFDYIDDIYEALEDEFGRCACMSCSGEDDGDETGHDSWPSPCLNGGSEWWGLS